MITFKLDLKRVPKIVEYRLQYNFPPSHLVPFKLFSAVALTVKPNQTGGKRKKHPSQHHIVARTKSRGFKKYNDIYNDCSSLSLAQINAP